MKYLVLGRQLKEIAEFVAIQQQCCSIEGWLDPLEGYLLYLLAAQGPGVGEIVEIGSYLGRSTAFLASGSQAACREKVTAIDHFQGSPEHQGGPFASEVLKKEGTTLHQFEANLKRFGLLEQVTPIVASSADGARNWRKPIRLLFIDADHTYESLRADFENWSPFVIPGGVICFHDIGTIWEGATRYYKELLASTREFKEIITVQSIRTIERRRGDFANASRGVSE